MSGVAAAGSVATEAGVAALAAAVSEVEEDSEAEEDLVAVVVSEVGETFWARGLCGTSRS